MITYLKAHTKPLGLLVAAIYTAFRPWLIDGQTWTSAAWLSFGLFLGGAVVTYLQKNSTIGIAARAKEAWVVLAALLGALVAVLPDGISRADIGTIIVAVAAALWSLIDGDTPRHPGSGDDAGHITTQGLFTPLAVLTVMALMATAALIRLH